MKQCCHKCRQNDSWQIRSKLINVEQFQFSPKMCVNVVARNDTCYAKNAATKLERPSKKLFYQIQVNF